MHDHTEPTADGLVEDPATATGLRRSTAAGRRAETLADGYCGLPDGVTRWRLAAALRAAARPLGLTAPMLRLLEHYIDLTYDQDWAADSEPVVIRPLVEIAEHLDRSERQIRNIERALVDRGLMAWRDSGNHHRKGRRDRATGRLLYAYGPSLAPLGARAAEIIAQAAAARAELAAARRLRIALSALRRRVRTELAAAQALKLDVSRQTDALAGIPERAPAGMGLSALVARRDALTALAQEVRDLLTQSTPRQATEDEIAGKPEIHGRHKTDTPKNNPINGRCIAKKNASSTVRKSPNDANRDAIEPTDPSHGADDVPLALALAAAGTTLRSATASARTSGWAALIDAACEICPLLGIDGDLWGEACRRLGRRGAALAVLLIERGAERPAGGAVAAIRRPPAYLRGMLQRAGEGALHLDRSVRGWASASVAP